MVSIEARQATFSYKNCLLFDRTSFDLGIQGYSGNAGRIIAILGASGSGKTTLLKLIAGLEKLNSGFLSVRPIETAVSYLPQDVVLFEHLSRMANARYFQAVGTHRHSFDEKLFQHLAVKLRLATALHSTQSIMQLSGGERQRLALLRALSIRPGLLLLDEPCTGLDVAVKRDFLAAMREIADEFQLAIVYVTHHRDEVLLASDEIAYIYVKEGASARSVTVGSLDQMLAQPVTIELAQFLSPESLNVLKCTLRGEELIWHGDESMVARIHASGQASGHYQVAFPPRTLRWSTLEGAGVIPCGESSQYRFVRTSERDGVTLIGQRDEKFEGRAVLDGPGILFDANGHFVRRVEFESPKQKQTQIAYATDR